MNAFVRLSWSDRLSWAFLALFAVYFGAHLFLALSTSKQVDSFGTERIFLDHNPKGGYEWR